MACRSVAAVLIAVVASVATIGLQGCGSGGGGEPELSLFQNLGTGACRTEDDTPGVFTCHNEIAADCKNRCNEDASCIAYETTTEDRECKCEIHTTAITKIEPENHTLHACYIKVSFDHLGNGACRTAVDTPGDFKCAETKLDAAECRDSCLADASCVAYETTTEDRDCTCEIHTTAITKIEPENHTLHDCYSLKPVTMGTASYV